MATQEVAIRQESSLISKSDELSNIQRIGNILAASGYFADAREMAQAAVKVMAGQELGLPPIASMMGINIIKGKIALGAHLIASRIKAHGYDYRIKQHDDKGCVLEFLSKPDGERGGKRQVIGCSSFTAEDATRAGIKSDMYTKYPRNMYFSRAISNGAKWYTPDVFGGAPVYTAEELGAAVDEDGNVERPEAIGVDTGPHQPGTREAQQFIAERKIAQMQAPPAAEPPQVKPSKKSDSNFFATMLEGFRLIKEIIGEDAYYRCLRSHGVDHANQFKDRASATAAYKMMAAYKQAMPESDAAEPAEPTAEEMDAILRAQLEREEAAQ